MAMVEEGGEEEEGIKEGGKGKERSGGAEEMAQNPCGVPQPSVTPIPWDPTCS